MRLDEELRERGYSLVTQNKCTKEWLCALMEMTRRVRADILHIRHRNYRICILVAMLAASIGIAVGLIPFAIEQLPVFFIYWSVIMIVFKFTYIQQINDISEDAAIEMEICLVKGTLHNMPMGSVVLQAVATEANRNRICQPIDFKLAHKIESYYAVCRCKSTTVVTPLRDYEAVEVFD